MDKTYHQRIFSKNLPDNQRIVVTLELHSIGNQSPYFSATADIYHFSRLESAGMQHDAIKEHFPELEKYLKWHLFSVNNGPMHYLANSLFWLGWYKRDSFYTSNDTPNLEHFKSTAIYGALDTDSSFNPAEYVYSETVSNKVFHLDKNSKNTQFIPDSTPNFEVKLAVTDWLVNRMPRLYEAFDADMRVLFDGYELVKIHNSDQR